MEESLNENEVQQPVRSPPKRRRSTFFERRESLAPQPVYTENIEPMKRESPEKDLKHSEDLLRYHDKLLQEKNQWKKEVNDRRHKYHDLRQQYQIAAKAPSRTRISYSALSNEDIEFLKRKTNISKLVDSQRKLHTSVKDVKALYGKANDLDDVILKYCEDRVHKITEYIVDNSMVEPKK